MTHTASSNGRPNAIYFPGDTTTKAASVRKQLGTKNSKSKEGRQETNGGETGGKHVRKAGEEED